MEEATLDLELELDDGPEGEETVLDAALWALSDAGLIPPPLPSGEIPALSEYAMNAVYGSEPQLAEIQSRSGLANRLTRHGWPRPGVAFGFYPVGLGVNWFYTLCGEHALLHVSFRFAGQSAEAFQGGIGEINQVNRLLDAYFAEARHGSMYNRPYPPHPGELRFVTCISNDSGRRIEEVASWSETDGLSAFREQNEILTAPGRAAEDDDPPVILRL